MNFGNFTIDATLLTEENIEFLKRYNPRDFSFNGRIFKYYRCKNFNFFDYDENIHELYPLVTIDQFKDLLNNTIYELW